MVKKFSRFVSLLLVVFMLASLAIGCGGNSTDTKKNVDSSTGVGSGNEPLLEYTYVTELDPSKFADAKTDVVTPYIEKKFNIKAKEVIWYNAQVQPFKEMINQWIAADNLPDVFLTSNSEFQATANLGIFADVEKYVKESMPNLNKYFDSRYWNAFKNDGVLYQIPSVEVSTANPMFANDPYVTGSNYHALWAREDILKLAGYTFEPIADIAKRTTDVGKKPTAEDFKITPAIDTPEAFYQLLKKIQSLNLKVGDKPMIPFEMYDWYQWHLGSMFDYCNFRVDDKGEVSGYLGTPGAKDYYKFLNKLYNENLIDQDFSIQKSDQMEAKVASGRVAVGGWTDNFSKVKESIQKIAPEATIRNIAWPKQTPGKGFFDVFKGGFRSVTINKKFKEIERLIKYFDWFYSDEGLDIITWGPESAGLWEMKDGKKVFKDKAVEADILSGKKGGNGVDKYGLFDSAEKAPTFFSKAANGVPFLNFPNPKTYLKSYPLKLDINVVAADMFDSAGRNNDGTSAYATGDAAAATDTYWWGDFLTKDSALLLTAKSDADFNAAWDKVYQIFLKTGQYEQAVKDMTKILKP